MFPSSSYLAKPYAFALIVSPIVVNGHRIMHFPRRNMIRPRFNSKNCTSPKYFEEMQILKYLIII